MIPMKRGPASPARVSEVVRPTKQDATRRRRTRDEARRQWYAHWRSRRWARHFFDAVPLPT